MLLFILLLLATVVWGFKPYTVQPTPRGLLIDGQPRLLIAGSIHYPRSTPQMWDQLMKKAKNGGINTIDTYVFWNIHEPVKRQYDFVTDRANLPLFLQLARENDLYVMLRIGPYICAEWNYGGFPQWLRHEPGIVFRTYNEPFMREMELFMAKVIDVTRDFLPEHGGPLIGMQIENEYANHQRSEFPPGDGDKYAAWCGRTALGFNVSVPWIMCDQRYPVKGIISTHNNMYANHFPTTHRKEPAMWTEMWPAWFQLWDEAVPHRPAEDVSFAIAEWVAEGGSYLAYYMYQGGTNFGRTAGGPFIMTSYDYDGFLDEYGLENWQKYLHLQELHQVLLDNEDVLMSNPSTTQPDILHSELNDVSVRAYVYGKVDGEYLAFLVNSNRYSKAQVAFDGQTVTVPRWSVAIVGSGKGVLLVTSELSSRTKWARNHPTHYKPLPEQVLDTKVIEQAIPIPDYESLTIRFNKPLEQISLTDDKTDYLWYQTQVTVDCSNPQVEIDGIGDVALVYVDGEYVGMGAGEQFSLARNLRFDIPKNKKGSKVTLSILSETMGMAHVTEHLERYTRGLLGTVKVCGTDVTKGKWRMQVGLTHMDGEYDKPPTPPFFTETSQSTYPRWYGIELDTKQIKDGISLAVDMNSMNKGQLWINNRHLGRYWLRRAKSHNYWCRECQYGYQDYSGNQCRTGCGEPSQRYYHLPREYIEATDNILWVLEEIGGGDIGKVQVVERIAPEPPMAVSGWQWNNWLLIALVALFVWALKQWVSRRQPRTHHRID